MYPKFEWGEFHKGELNKIKRPKLNIKDSIPSPAPTKFIPI